MKVPPSPGIDEFGPLNLMPRKSKAWGPVRRPCRLRATYNRYDGVPHMLAIASCVRWRNARAKPKTNFAPDSPVRT